MNRRDRVAVVTRSIPEHLTERNLFGEQVMITKRCSKCKQNKPIIDFYVASRRDTKNANSTRDVCIPCWDADIKLKKSGKKDTINSPELPI